MEKKQQKNWKIQTALRLASKFFNLINSFTSDFIGLIFLKLSKPEQEFNVRFNGYWITTG
jgi:hypothetical protein